MQIQSVHDKIAIMLDKLETIEEVLQFSILQKENENTKLLMKGFPAYIGNPETTVRSVLIDKLGLQNFVTHYLTAASTDDGIVFDVKNIIDKKRILYRAADRLSNSHLKIIDYIVYDIDLRFGSD